MSPSNCIIYPEIELTSGAEGTDSKAHVIPSALGGRLKPKGILSRKANELLNDKVDLPLIDAFSDLMALIGGIQDRKSPSGKAAVVRLEDEAGHRYDVAFGEHVKLTAPEFEMVEDERGLTSISLAARTLKEARTLLGRVKARFPEFDIEEALQQAAVVNVWPSGRLHGQFEIGPK